MKNDEASDEEKIKRHEKSVSKVQNLWKIQEGSEKL
jgi:hypothetical protein